MAEINLYGPIGQARDDDGITAAGFRDMLAAVDPDDSLSVFINSPGGGIFDGLTIYQDLVNRPGENHIEIRGVAASIASVIAMAGDTITVGQSSRVMIHNPMGPSAIAFGPAGDLREAAEDTLQTAELLDEIRDTLADVYAARTGTARQQILDWMSAEKWLTAADAIQHGFADKVTPNKSLAASVYPQPIAVAIDKQTELEEVARVARSLTLRTPAGSEAKTKAAGALRLAQAKLMLTS